MRNCSEIIHATKVNIHRIQRLLGLGIGNCAVLFKPLLHENKAVARFTS